MEGVSSPGIPYIDEIKDVIQCARHCARETRSEMKQSLTSRKLYSNRGHKITQVNTNIHSIYYKYTFITRYVYI